MVMASQMLGRAFFKAGLYPQCYSLFGGERRGAPVVSFLRVDRKKILLKCDIKRPDEMLYFDAGLIDPDEVGALRSAERSILVSTGQQDTGMEILRGFRVGIVNAPAIARGLGLGRVINTTILGAYCRLSGNLPFEHILAAIEEMVPAKREANVEAARQGYAGLTMLKGEN